jgi:hypothetical protein
MKLKEFNTASITHLVNGAERPKTTVTTVAGVRLLKRTIHKRHCVECKKPGHDESNCWFKHPEKRPQNYPPNHPQNCRRNAPLQARVTHTAEKSQEHRSQQDDQESDD